MNECNPSSPSDDVFYYFIEEYCRKRNLNHLTSEKISKIHDASKSSDQSNEFAKVDTDFESICKLGETKKLELLLRNEKSAAQCTLKIGSLLQLAIQHKQREIVDLLLDHGSNNNFVFLDNLTKIVATRSYDNKDLDDRISSLVDAGLTVEHLTQVLRNSTQNDVATQALLRNGADINKKIGRKSQTVMWYFFRSSSCFGDNMDTYEIFHNHLEKLKIANIPISKVNIELFKEIQKRYKDLYGLDNTKTLANLDPNCIMLSECKKEIEKMSNNKLNNNTTLKDVLSKNDYQLASLVSNEEFQNIVLSYDLKIQYHQYGNLLKLQYRKGLLRKALLDAAIMSFQFLLSHHLPDDCCMEILMLLSNIDLKNLIKAQYVL